MKRFLVSRALVPVLLLGALVVLSPAHLALAATPVAFGDAVYNGGFEQHAHAAPARRQLFIFLQGIASQLTDTEAAKGIIPSDSFGQPDGIYSVLKKQFSGAEFLMYSYTGSTSSGKPVGYKCSDTLSQSLAKDVINLDKEIVAALRSNPNTDIYLIGHSLGGVIAFGFLSEFFVPTSGRIFPSTAHLKGVITLDSPLGGVTSDQSYSHVANAYLNTTSCGSFTYRSRTVPGDLVPVDDLVTIFKSASSTPERPDAPQGARATVTALFEDTRVSNQVLAEKANKLGVSILSVGNDNDFLFDPKACSITLRPGVGFAPLGVFPLPGVNVTLTDVDFTDTQLLDDGGNGSRLYGRSFTATAPKTCGAPSDIAASHFAVLTDKTVQTALSHFLLDGGTPIPLPGKPGGD